MSFGKNLEISVLLDFYSALLNDKQRDFIDLYYNEDLSLAEIAERESITRQGVRDCIKRGEQILLDAENALGLAEKTRRLEEIADRLSRNADSLTADEIRTAAKEIIDTI